MKVILSIVIPTLNNDKGLKYLLNYFKHKPYAIIVVNNIKKNLGFAGGVNEGAKNVDTKWLLILNDDIFFQDQILKIKNQNDKSKIKNNKSSTLESLIDYAEQKNLDAVSPILVNPDGKVENYGYEVLPIGKIELVKSVESAESVKIDGLTAACLLVKTNVFKKLDGFDESFFAYLEDVDFFLRFKKSGYKMAICKEVKVLHSHMTTTKTMGNFKARQDMINWWRLYLKHEEKFKFDFNFILERLRNISGFLKATFSN